MNNDIPIFISNDLDMKIENFINQCKKINLSSIDFLHSGNLSLKLNDKYIVIKPSGLSYDNLSPQTVSIIELETGDLLRGLKPSSDLSMHLSLYKKLPHINSIIHTHSHFATVMAIIGSDLSIISTMHADYFGKPIICLPYLNHRKNNLGDQILKKDITHVCLLEKHGTVCFTESIEKTIEYAIVLEEICRQYFHIVSLGKNISSLKKEDTESLYDYYHNKYGN